MLQHDKEIPVIFFYYNKNNREIIIIHNFVIIPLRFALLIVGLVYHNHC